MSNNNTLNNKSKKRNPSTKEIETAKRDYLEEESKLISEKVFLGYGDVPLAEFLEIKPDSSEDQSKISALIDVQDRLKKTLLKKDNLFIEENVVDELNKKHAVVHTDRFYILTEKEDPARRQLNFTLESKQSFKDTYENQIIQLPNKRKSSRAEIWLKSKHRRQFDGIIFNPNLREENSKHYNLWKGFSITQKRGCCEKYKAHARYVICDGDPANFEFLWKWMARLVQKPHKLGEIAPILLGGQGTGKNTFVDALGKILGGHYLPLDNISQLLGKFNFHLKNAVLIHGNEALWGGNRKDIGTLKSIITEKDKIIEGKGKDVIVVPNFTHLILSSNEDWPVHMDRDDRRFFVLKVSDIHKEDKTYFKEIHDELQNGGLEALLFELLQENISEFNHREPPQTDAALKIKLTSTTSSERYIFEVLKVGCFDLGNAAPSESWPANDKRKQSVYADYILWCENEGETKQTSALFGKAVLKLIPLTQTVRSRNKEIREYRYAFPTQAKARKDFEKIYKVSSNVWDS